MCSFVANLLHRDKNFYSVPSTMWAWQHIEQCAIRSLEILMSFLRERFMSALKPFVVTYSKVMSCLQNVFLETEKNALCFPHFYSHPVLCLFVHNLTIRILFSICLWTQHACVPVLVHRLEVHLFWDAGAPHLNRPDIPWSPPPAVNRVRATAQRGKEKWKNLKL